MILKRALCFMLTVFMLTPLAPRVGAQENLSKKTHTVSKYTFDPFTEDIDTGETFLDLGTGETYAADYSGKVGAKVYNAGGYTTYQPSDHSFRWQIPNTVVNGVTCTAAQGLNVGTNYLYHAKIDSTNTYAAITRINANTGEKVVMSYYASTSATSPSNCTTLGHANEIVVCSANDEHFLFVATTDTDTALTRLKINGNGLYFQGYFKLVTTAGKSINAHAVRHIKTSGGYFYLLVKRGQKFYYCKVGTADAGGSASSPTEVTCYQLFEIDKRNAVFATSNSSYSVMPNLEGWTTQGFAYSKTEKVLYVPLWDAFLDKTRSCIITYDVSGAITDEALATEADSTGLIFPSTTNFLLQNSSLSMFEIESCGFRTSQGADGDRRLYFNTNAPISYEGIYSIAYNEGSGTFNTPITTENSIIYTVKYNANGGTDTGTTNLVMNDTRHVRGLSTKLRKNYFARDGYSFSGWNLYRKSDGKWLYFDADGTARWYTKGEQPETSVLALYEDRRNVSALTMVNGDVITCYAQWTHNSTGTKTFYVRYDANGGKGTMAESKVVYGTSTKISANSFTRDGYVFVGWRAYRASQGQWNYLSTADHTHKWMTVTEDTGGYVFKIYSDESTLSQTTSVDTDLLTLYACWARVTDPNIKESLLMGEAYTPEGTVESTGDLYQVTATVKSMAGTAVQSNTTTLYGKTLAIADMGLEFAALTAGNYRLQITVSAMSTSTSIRSFTLLDKAFEVIDDFLKLTDAAVKAGHSIDDDGIMRISAGLGPEAVSALFVYGIELVTYEGSAVTTESTVGTGYRASRSGKSCILAAEGDLNGDGLITSVDCINAKLGFSGGIRLSPVQSVAADLDRDGTLAAADYLILRTALTKN
ncbi:MAG: InlB B-repeat-containing protein [Clostridia bacterium]|nr:InlB B-repeat-containing protein [Clostridia bacterium]